MRLTTKRVYDEPARADGRRILVDRLWPRGLSKVAAKIDFWAKAIAPSSRLRQWYRHEPEKWNEFRRRYFAELKDNPDGLGELRAQLGRGQNTSLYGSREVRLNNATALIEYLQKRQAGEDR
jgi:uncharacterized protein YeaO (DUF488 family)